MVEYNPFWFAVLIIGVVFISMAILFGLKIAYSQDIDPNGYCIYNNTHPFNELCKQQLHENQFILDLIEQMCTKPTSQCDIE